MPRDPLEGDADDGSSPLLRMSLSRDRDELLRAVRDSRFTGDLALALLQRHDLPPEVLEALARNRETLKDRKVLAAIVTHPRTPRYVWLPMLRHLFTFELMKISLMPMAAADLKMSAEQAILARGENISSGERISLAKQGSGQLASALLCDSDARVVEAALNNPRLTEAGVTRSLNGEREEHTVTAIATHPKWSLRVEVKLALLKQQNLPLARAIAICDRLTAPDCRLALENSRLPENVKNYLQQKMERRAMRETS